MSSVFATMISGLCLMATVQSSVKTANDLVTFARMMKAAQGEEGAARQCGENAALVENLHEAKVLLSSWPNTGRSPALEMWGWPSEALVTGDCRVFVGDGERHSGTEHEFSFQPHHERNPLIDFRLPNWRPRLRLEGEVR